MVALVFCTTDSPGVSISQMLSELVTRACCRGTKQEH